jgi:hypothetical protein
MIISAISAGVCDTPRHHDHQRDRRVSANRIRPAAHNEESTMTNDTLLPRPAQRAGCIPRNEQRIAELMTEIKAALMEGAR